MLPGQPPTIKNSPAQNVTNISAENSDIHKYDYTAFVKSQYAKCSAWFSQQELSDFYFVFIFLHCCNTTHLPFTIRGKKSI